MADIVIMDPASMFASGVAGGIQPCRSVGAMTEHDQRGQIVRVVESTVTPRMIAVPLGARVDTAQGEPKSVV